MRSLLLNASSPSDSLTRRKLENVVSAMRAHREIRRKARQLELLEHLILVHEDGVWRQQDWRLAIVWFFCLDRKTFEPGEHLKARGWELGLVAGLKSDFALPPPEIDTAIFKLGFELGRDKVADVKLGQWSTEKDSATHLRETLDNYFNQVNPSSDIVIGLRSDWRLEVTERRRASSEASHEAPPAVSDKSLIRLTTLSDLRRTAPASNPKGTLRILDPLRSDLNFVGRNRELEHLWQWLDDVTGPSFYVIVGPGGSGKTRLAVEFLKVIEQRQRHPMQWHAGLLPGLLTEDACEQVLTFENLSREQAKDTLIILDNASTWATALERSVIPALCARPPGEPRVRFLLLDRGATERHGWFWNLRTAAGDDGTCSFPKSPLRLGESGQSLQLDLDERRALLDATLERLNIISGKPRLQISTTALEQLKAPQFGVPLALLMAAFISHYMGDLSCLSMRRIELAEAIASHEVKRIKTLARVFNASEFLLLHVAAYTALVGGLTATGLVDVLREESESLNVSSKVAIVELAQLFSDKVLPPAEPGLAAILIAPDIVAGVFVENIFDDPFHFAPDTIRRAFKRAPVKVIRTLVHMAQVFTPVSGDLGLEKRQRCILDWLATLLRNDANSIKPAELRSIAFDLPWRSVSTAEVVADFFERVLEFPNVPVQLRAIALLNRAVTKATSGHMREAVNTALGAWLDIAGAISPQATDTDACTVIRVASGCLTLLSENGEAELALSVSTELTQTLRQQLGSSWLVAYALPLLLICRTDALIEVGQLAEAESTVNEALSYYQHDMGSVGRETKVACVAHALGIKARLLAERGKVSEASAAADQRLRLARELVPTNPDRFQPELVEALIQSAGMMAMGQPQPNSVEAALTMTDEALQVAETLVRQDRPRFLPVLASAFLQRAYVQRKSPDQFRSGLESTGAAINLYGEASNSHYSRDLPDLARCYLVSADLYNSLGDVQEALKATDIGIACYRELVQRNSLKYLPDLAKSLYWRGEFLLSNGKRDDALAAFREILGFGKKLVKRDPYRFMPAIAHASAFCGRIQSHNGKHAEARTFFANAMRFIKPCAALFPAEGHQLLAAQAAHAYSLACRAVGQSADLGLVAPYLTSTDFGDGDYSVLREQASQSPPEVLIRMAKTFQNDSHRPGQPLQRFWEQTVRRAEWLVQAGPDAEVLILAERAQTLENSARQCCHEDPSRALDALNEAIPIVRLLTQQNRQRFLGALASALAIMSDVAYRLNRIPEALEFLVEAIQFSTELAKADESNPRIPPTITQLFDHQLALFSSHPFIMTRSTLKVVNDQMKSLRDLVEAQPDQFGNSYLISQLSRALCLMTCVRLTAKRKYQIRKILGESSPCTVAASGWPRAVSCLLDGLLHLDAPGSGGVGAASALRKIAEGLVPLASLRKDLDAETRMASLVNVYLSSCRFFSVSEEELITGMNSILSAGNS